MSLHGPLSTVASSVGMGSAPRPRLAWSLQDVANDVPDFPPPNSGGYPADVIVTSPVTVVEQSRGGVPVAAATATAEGPQLSRCRRTPTETSQSNQAYYQWADPDHGGREGGNGCHNGVVGTAEAGRRGQSGKVSSRSRNRNSMNAPMDRASRGGPPLTVEVRSPGAITAALTPGKEERRFFASHFTPSVEQADMRLDDPAFAKAVGVVLDRFRSMEKKRLDDDAEMRMRDITVRFLENQAELSLSDSDSALDSNGSYIDKGKAGCDAGGILSGLCLPSEKGKQDRRKGYGTVVAGGPKEVAVEESLDMRIFLEALQYRFYSLPVSPQENGNEMDTLVRELTKMARDVGIPDGRRGVKGEYQHVKMVSGAIACTSFVQPECVPFTF